MFNFLKLLSKFCCDLFFPPFCCGCQEVLLKEKMLCPDCAESFFAFWDFDKQENVLAPCQSKLAIVCRAQKNKRHYKHLKYALFLKALIELESYETCVVIEESCFEELKNLSLFFRCEKFNHLSIYTNKNIIFLGDSLSQFTYFKTYFSLSYPKTLKAIFLYD